MPGLSVQVLDRGRWRSRSPGSPLCWPRFGSPRVARKMAARASLALGVAAGVLPGRLQEVRRRR